MIKRWVQSIKKDNTRVTVKPKIENVKGKETRAGVVVQGSEKS